MPSPTKLVKKKKKVLKNPCHFKASYWAAIYCWTVEVAAYTRQHVSNHRSHGHCTMFISINLKFAGQVDICWPFWKHKFIMLYDIQLWQMHTWIRQAPDTCSLTDTTLYSILIIIIVTFKRLSLKALIALVSGASAKDCLLCMMC